MESRRARRPTYDVLHLNEKLSQWSERELVEYIELNNFVASEPLNFIDPVHFSVTGHMSVYNLLLPRVKKIILHSKNND